MNSKRTVLATTLALLLSACGGGSNSGVAPAPPGPSGDNGPSDVPAPQIGMFLDAPVAGIAYRIVGKTEVKQTNANGEYEYQPGEQVIFSIGGIELPAVAATGIVTPLTVFDTNDLTAPSVVNLARLLQTLDTDGNPENGITIAAAAHSNAAGMAVNFADTAAFETSVVNLIANGGGATELVTSQDAIEHVQAQLVANGLSLVGTWKVREVAGVVTTVTFLNDGHYLLVQTDPDADESGGPGVEYGTYTWNSTTGELSVKVVKETDGEWGLSHPLGKTIAELKSDGSVLEVHDTEDDVAEVFAMDRLAADADHPLVGTWKGPAEVCGCELSLVMFTADGDYVMAEIAEADAAGQSGFEVGTYDWTDGVLSVEISSDTNGEWGLAEANAQFTLPSVEVQDDSLVIDLVDEDAFALTRLP
jgi:hypothetical protein